MKNISIYKIISVVAAITLTFILVLGQKYSTDPKQDTKQCLKNMKDIHQAVERYMQERGENFNGDVSDLFRTGYLKKSTYICPSANPGDKYFIKGDLENNVAQVLCPMADILLDHVLPQSVLK